MHYQLRPVASTEGSAGKLINLQDGRLSVGRDSSNDIVLSSDRASPFHATLIVEAGEYFLIDLGSTNGSFVNGEAIAGKRRFKAWDTLRFGDMEFEVLDPSGRRPTRSQPIVDD
ncbi:MAG: FHA domain-containing protein, partial [Nitrospira sp.]|nr:FHA domain-containing protein [Nitrospira sp.]